MNRNRIALALALVLAASFVLAPAALAQTTPDPAIQKAREDTAVVFDLGRTFGYLMTIEKDSKVPALSATQLKDLYDIMVQIRTTKRIEPAPAKAWLAKIEDKILTPAQLMAVDKLAAAAAAARTGTPGAGTGTGPGASGTGGSSSLQSYVAGGEFNPITDATKTMGTDFKTFFDYAAKKLGK
ncbi:MAG TPA: hypothetical protein PKW82_06640 [Spirochaetales bacterium]|nr:hypothetical protein [Spirochaetales bacterium]